MLVKNAFTIDDVIYYQVRILKGLAVCMCVCACVCERESECKRLTCPIHNRVNDAFGVLSVFRSHLALAQPFPEEKIHLKE